MQPVIEWRNGRLYIKEMPIVEAKTASTTLGADIASGSSTLTVKSIRGFAVNQILLIGELGSEDSEIIKTHGSTAPTGTTVTLLSTTVRDHGAGTKVYVIAFDQVELSNASTTGGSKTTLTTSAGSGILSLEADVVELPYIETEYSSGYYFARFKNSIAGTFGAYTDPIPYGGWETDQVGYMILLALKRNRTDFNDDLTPAFCYAEINSCLSLTQGKLKRWPQYQTFNAVLGQLTRGINIVTLPADIYDQDTWRSLIEVRVGDGQGLAKLDAVQFERRLGDAINTQVRTQASAGGTSLAIDNSFDFADSGTVVLYLADGTRMEVTYTGVTRSATAGVLTGIAASGTGSITATVPVDTVIWQNAEEGTPDSATVRDGNLEVYPLPDAQSANKNVRGDYWKVATQVNSDGDTIDVHRFDMVQDYLTWKVRMLMKNEGVLDVNDGYYLGFRERLNDAVRTTPTGPKRRMMPKVNRIRWPRVSRGVRPPAGGGYTHDPSA